MASGFGHERRAVFALTATEAVARTLSLGFYLLAAHSFSVSDFGVVRYTITLSLLALAPLLVLAMATNRELGAARGGEAETRVVLGSSLAIAVWTWLATAALCVAAGAANLTGSASLAGLVIVVTGLGAFNLYYQIARGLGQIKRIAFTYMGGSLLQLIVFGALIATVDLSPFEALVIFGVSSAVPILACELVAPVIRGRGVSFTRDAARTLWRIGAPLLVAQAGFMIWFSADQVWVDSTLGSAQIGLYGAAKTLIQALFVLMAGSIGVILPRIAELRSAGLDQRARRLILAMTLELTVLAIVVAAVMIAARSPLLRVIFGDSYVSAGGALAALAVGMAAYATFVAITASAIGWGRPGLSALGISIAGVSEVSLLLFAGGSDITFAGWMSAASILLGLAAVLVALRLRPLR
jgi:O-antigen/teichoic acid export membrane protein